MRAKDAPRMGHPAGVAEYSVSGIAEAVPFQSNGPLNRQERHPPRRTPFLILGLRSYLPAGFFTGALRGAVSARAWSIIWKSLVRSRTSTKGAPLLLAVTTQMVGVCSMPTR